MNERIRELEKQAWDYVDQIWDWTNPDNPSKETLFKTKFAELIVLEMCNVLDKEQWDIGRDWICDDGTRIIPKVKEHFGVEE
jgi:hypothetical protein